MILVQILMLYFSCEQWLLIDLFFKQDCGYDLRFQDKDTEVMTSMKL